MNFIKRFFTKTKPADLAQDVERLFVTAEELMCNYEQAIRINADQSAQLEKLKRQINEQAQLIADYERAQTDSNERAEWVRQLVVERGAELGINHSMHWADAARVALAAVWDAHDHHKLEADHCRVTCAELREKLRAATATELVA